MLRIGTVNCESDGDPKVILIPTPLKPRVAAAGPRVGAKDGLGSLVGRVEPPDEPAHATAVMSSRDASMQAARAAFPLTPNKFVTAPGGSCNAHTSPKKWRRGAASRHPRKRSEG